MSATASPTPRELDERLRLVADALARSPDPLEAPFGLGFARQAGAEHLEAWGRHARTTRAPLVLYIHVPFCARVCDYCLLSARRARGRAFTDAYVAALRREIALVAPATAPLRASALHVGGGTPSLLAADQLDALLGDLERFPRAPGFRVGVECHPRSTTRDKIEVLAARGVGRISLGVESFTPEVLRGIDRADQRPDDVRRAVDEARRAGLAVNVDVLAGLPGETEASFAETIRQAVTLDVSSLSVNRFLAENTPLAAGGWAPGEEDVRRADRMLLLADRLIRELRPPRWPDRPLAEPSYGAQYVWDPEEDRPYFQEDMIGPTSTLALGHGGMGHALGERFWTSADDPADYVRALEEGRAPDVLSCPIPPRFDPAFYVADRATRGMLSARAFAAAFGVALDDVFGPELAHLCARGRLAREGDRVWKPRDRGFQALHLLAALCFTADELRARWPADGAAPPPGARDYALVGAELPPSLIWCRIAMRAARAGGSAAGLTKPAGR